MQKRIVWDGTKSLSVISAMESEWAAQTLDFVVQTPLRTIPIEVKAGENVRAKSLKTYVERHPEYGLKGLRISMLGYENQTWMENIPLYGIQKYFASCAPQAPFSLRKACE